MRRGRTLILVLLIIVIGLVVAFVAFRQFVLAPQTTAEQPVYVDIYYAAQNIPQGGRITEDLLATMRIPEENVVTTMYTRDELPVLLTNKVAKYPIDQGTPLTESVVVDSSSAVPISGPQWAALIPPGMTAMTIPVDRLSVSGYAINDGAHVNINACLLFVDVDPSFQTALPNNIATLTGTGFAEEGGLPTLSLGAPPSETPQGRLELDPSVQQPYYIIPSEEQRPRLVCQMLLQDVVVMKLGNFPLTSISAASTTTTTTELAPTDPQQSPSTPPDIITLIVSPQDSITLSYLIYTNAKISMSLRNPSDQTRLATEASTLQFLLSQYNIPVPAKLPYAMQPALTDLVSPFLPNDVVTVPAE
jgi:pilus assembly protein CpaB